MLIYLAFIIIHGYLDYLYPSNGGEKRMLIYLAFIIIHGLSKLGLVGHQVSRVNVRLLYAISYRQYSCTHYVLIMGNLFINNKLKSANKPYIEIVIIILTLYI